MILVLSVPLLTAVAIATYWRFEFRELFWQRSGYMSHNGSNDHHPLCYMTCGVLAVLIYPRMMAWLALWIGLVCKSPARATIVSTVAIVAWCAVPALLVAWIETEYSIRSHEWVGWLFLSSPASIIPINEFSEVSRGCPPGPSPRPISPSTDRWPWFSGLSACTRPRNGSTAPNAPSA